MTLNGNVATDGYGLHNRARGNVPTNGYGRAYIPPIAVTKKIRHTPRRTTSDRDLADDVHRGRRVPIQQAAATTSDQVPDIAVE